MKPTGVNAEVSICGEGELVMRKGKLMPIEILSPSSEGKLGPFWMAPENIPARFELEDIKNRLWKVRSDTVANLDLLLQQLALNLKNYPGVELVQASDADEAVGAVERFCGSAKNIVVNMSSAVKELEEELTKHGFVVENGYFQEYASSDVSTRKGYWEVPRFNPWIIWQSFSSRRLDWKATKGGLKGKIPVLGVTAVSAEDASIHFLEHFQNISRAIATAERIVIVIGLEKVVKTREEAYFQNRCVGLFGYESILYNFNPMRGTAETGKKPPAREEPLIDAPLYSDRNLPDGPHVLVILLDNGRRQLLTGEFRDILLCISCQACIKECPTCRFYGGEGMASPRDYIRKSLLKQRDPNFCTFCNSCERHCPLHLSLPLMMMQARSTYYHRYRKPLENKILQNPRVMLGFGSQLSTLSNTVLSNRAARGLMEGITGIDRRRKFPNFAKGTFSKFFFKRSVAKQKVGGKKKVAYFTGCHTEFCEPEVGKDVMEILDKNGFEVSLPSQCCCGIPKLTNGYFEEAKREVEYNLNSLIGWVERGYRILVSCPGCGRALKHDFPKIEASDRSLMVATNTVDFCELLAELHAQNELDLTLGEVSARIAYHLPCHLKNQGLKDTTVRVLRLIPGLEVENIDCGCCGLSGTFGFKKEFFAHSMEVGEAVFKEVKQKGPDYLCTDCGICKLQLKQGTGLDVFHPATLLCRAYRSGQRDKDGRRFRQQLAKSLA